MDKIFTSKEDLQEELITIVHSTIDEYYGRTVYVYSSLFSPLFVMKYLYNNKAFQNVSITSANRNYFFTYLHRIADQACYLLKVNHIRTVNSGDKRTFHFLFYLP